MAFDAGMLYCVVHELNSRLYDAKVEKIGQPSAEEIHISLRHFGENLKLCMQTGAGRSRLSLTRVVGENPPTPPLFLTILRKHLAGAKLLSVTQEGFERVARITFSATDDMGYPVTRHLMCEVMGKYSNLMLLDGDDRVLAVLRPVDFTTSRLRQVLPGMRYELPPKQDKRSPLEETKEGFFQAISSLNPATLIDKFITTTYLGTASQVARQIAWETSGTLDATLLDCDRERLWEVFSTWFDALKHHKVTPTMTVDGEGMPLDFSYAPMTYFGADATHRTYDTFGDLLDACFGEKDKRERVKQRANDLFGILSRSLSRLERKIEVQTEEIRQADEGETYRRMADLITANIWALKRGDTHLTTVDFYDETGREVTIPLDARLSPQANAQRYYKYYTKSKHAKEYLAVQIETARGELEYLLSVEAFLESAETEQDLIELREELYKAGYASRMRGYAPAKQVKLRPISYITPDGGYHVLVGRNNIQNDALTFKTAEKNDLWFHVKGFPGSHVILQCAGEEPTARDYTFVATVAAIHSKAEGDMIPVDYTRVRYIKKPPAARPGFVTYSTNFTAYVRADKSVLETI